MAETVVEVIDRMHAEFAHAIPKGVAIGAMVEAWISVLERNGVPPTSVPQCYDAACDTRTQQGRGSFMPTVHDLVAEWLKVCTDEQREQLIDEGVKQRRLHFENQDKAAVTGPIPDFDAQVAKGRALRDAKRKRVAA